MDTSGSARLVVILGLLSAQVSDPDRPPGRPAGPKPLAIPASTAVSDERGPVPRRPDARSTCTVHPPPIVGGVRLAGELGVTRDEIRQFRRAR